MNKLKRSQIFLLLSAGCFLAGALIFGLAFFLRVFDPKIAAAVASVLIIAFLPLALIALHFKNMETEAERQAELERLEKKNAKKRFK